MDDLISEFITETSEHLGQLDLELIKLEHDPSNAKILGNIFRLVHTIKGTCGFLGLPRLEAVAHSSENVLGKIRDGAIIVTPEAISLVLESLDAIKRIIDYLNSHESEPEGDDAHLIARLNAFASGSATTHAPEPEAISPPVSEPSMPVVDTALLEQAAADIFSASQMASTSFAPPALASEAADITRKAKETAIAEGLAADPLLQGIASGISPQSIRVNLDVLDTLMQTVGELVLTRNQLLQMAKTKSDYALSSSLQQLSHITAELQEGIMKTRMQPVGNAWSKFPRLIRDLSRELGKKIDLRMTGEQTELDRQLIELIKDPLTHMVRNSADHGIELPADRRTSGKPEAGVITLSAFHAGGHIIIEIADDGRGLNIERIKQKVVENGLATPGQLASLSQQQIMQFIFRPGFSTAEKVTSVSGRGVGMDVVRSNIEKIGGTVELSSVYGKGSKFLIKIPLTLAIISVLIVEAANERFAIPQISVQEVLRIGGNSGHIIESINNASVLRLREKLLPMVSLAGILGLPDSGLSAQTQSFVAVCKAGGYSFGVVIDRVFDTEEIVVKPMSSALKHIGLYAGATIMGDGNVIMILDPNGLAHATGEADISGNSDAVEDIKQAIENTNLTKYLLFKAGAGAPKAVPLELVWRIEELDLSRSEMSGGASVLQYQGELMRLNTLPENDPAMLPTQGKHHVVVFSYDRKLFGLVVDAIVDIVSADYEIREHTPRVGYLGSMIVRERATDVLDVAYLLQSDTGSVQVPGSPPLTKNRLLLVEDSPFFRKLTVPFLAAAGYKVTAVENAMQAQKLLETHTEFDVIVSDIEMPGMDGFQFAQWCRAQPHLAHIPLFAFSASSHATAKSKQVGFKGLIAKTDRIALLQALASAPYEREGV